MTYFIKESNQDNVDLIRDFNKDLEDHKISFRLPVPSSRHSRTDNFIYEPNISRDSLKLKNINDLFVNEVSAIYVIFIYYNVYL